MAGQHSSAILGISAFYHDSAAALVVDGEIIAAAQEERFSRIRHDAQFPAQAVAYCLHEAGLRPEQLDYVAFYDKPLKKFERILETYLAFAPRGFASFRRAVPLWLEQKLHLPREIRRGLGGAFRGSLVFLDHHQSHAASAFFPSAYDHAAILCMDGVGEWATTSWGVGRSNRIRLEQAIVFPHSLGLLYSAFTYYAGFKVNSGEYKLMGLAPYGRPRYAELIKRHLIDIKPDGSYRLALEYFDYCAGLRMTNAKFHALFGGPAREPESELNERHADLAASVQAVLEEVVLLSARHVHARANTKRVCLAGGVALNSVANGRLLREGPFEEVWIQPAAGDAGGALGAALFTWHQLLDNPRQAAATDRQRGSLLGPAYGADDVRVFLDSVQAKYRQFADETELLDLVVTHLIEHKVVGWFQGRMEFGPRALGARSILADARDARMQTTLNAKIKHRESFRPFAPCVLAERAASIFDLPEKLDSPYMSLVVRVRDAYRAQVPAITHVDQSARIQTVDAARHGRFHRLLQRFEARTGCPLLINTSFNLRGEPIVNTPAEAYACFRHTDMDLLVLGDCVLFNADQPALPEAARARHRQAFELD